MVKMEKVHLLNGGALAYMGDAVYEVSIRKHLLLKGLTKTNDLHVRATTYVSAKAQAVLIKKMEAEDILTETEFNIFRRGRNTKSYSKAKNADHATYSASTGFEAVIGYLFLTDQKERLEELIEWCINAVEEEENE